MPKNEIVIDIGTDLNSLNLQDIKKWVDQNLATAYETEEVPMPEAPGGIADILLHPEFNHIWQSVSGYLVLVRMAAAAGDIIDPAIVGKEFGRRPKEQ